MEFFLLYVQVVVLSRLAQPAEQLAELEYEELEEVASNSIEHWCIVGGYKHSNEFAEPFIKESIESNKHTYHIAEKREEVKQELQQEILHECDEWPRRVDGSNLK